VSGQADHGRHTLTPEDRAAFKLAVETFSRSPIYTPPEPLEDQLRRLNEGEAKPSLLEEADEALGDMAQESRTSWQAVNLGLHLQPDDQQDVPRILHRSDGLAFFYAGKRNEIHGPYESGKSWVALLASREVIERGEAVVWIDFEDSPRSIAGRLLAIGVPEDQVKSRQFRYIGPAEPLNPTTETDLRLEMLDASLVVVDAVNEAMAASGLDPNKNSDVAMWYGTIPRLATEAGAALVVLDHVAKDPTNQRGAVGAGHKQAAIDGASYRADAPTPFGRGTTGVIRLKLKKDRQGYVRGLYPGWEPPVAEIAVDATDPDMVVFEVRPPTGGESFRPTRLMERVSQFLEQANEPKSLRDILAGVSGKQDFVRKAVAALISDGFVSEEKGARGAHLHTSVQPYREDA
jgi:AAA domain